MRSLARLIPGALIILIASAAVGLAINALRPGGIPLIRKPLRETRAFVKIERLIPPPSAKPAKPAPVHPKEIQASPKMKPAATKPATAHQSVQHAPKKAQALFTTLDDAKALFDRKAALFVDARTIEDYEVEHISGAISLYCEDFYKLYDPTLGGVPKDRLIVTFCSDSECREAVKLADALIARGHTRVVILLEGLPGWADAGYPTASGKEPE
jgi:rhodanese-related sulfurtransferase